MAVAGLCAPAPRLHRVHRGTRLRRGVAWSARCSPASPPRADTRPPRRPAVDRCGSRGRSRPSPARSTTLVGSGPGRPLRGGGLGGSRSARRRAASHLACRARPSTSPAGARRPGPDRATAVCGDHRGEPAASTAMPDVDHRRGNSPARHGTCPARGGPGARHRRWWGDLGVADRRQDGSAPRSRGTRGRNRPSSSPSPARSRRRTPWCSTVGVLLSRDDPRPGRCPLGCTSQPDCGQGCQA